MKKVKPKPKKRKKKKVAPTVPPVLPQADYWPKPGEQVLIFKSSVNFAEGKVGIVQHPHDGGWAVKVKMKKVNAENYGSLEAQDSEMVVWAEKVKPYTTPPDEERK